MLPAVTPAPVLFISNGTAEDLIGARLAALLGRRTLYAPLVGEGRAYAGLPEARRVGRVLRLPSGGFPFGSLPNLRSDLRAGLIGESLGQWSDAARGASGAGAVVVVGDAYALMVGTLAARINRRPLLHVQPLLSAQYLEGLDLRGTLRELNALGANRPLPYELRLARRAQAVFVRDAATQAYYRRRGVPARFAGSFAMDVLPAPERELHVPAGRPVLALLPGSRDDHRESLSTMLRAAALLPQVTPVVAWPHPWATVALPSGWTLEVASDTEATARGEGAGVSLQRGAFGAVARAADVAIGTAGTANEQLAGLGVPVIAFATRGPQYTAGFARRQGRLLGAALQVVDAHPAALAAAVNGVLEDPSRRAQAAVAGLGRIGPAGALPVIAAEIEALTEGAWPRHPGPEV
ncbi:lipid A disaccharide synthase [Deinococcus radiopugnans]|uniref:Lipid A disaccharide synthase n=1 Tax=Deinococcus radiopugnans TaxID=57497 RepID=A0A0A7KFK6_9DEIO|nr:lipid-A-disaccharide synthase-related protein [Deinococcus radiopugnans]AIZ44921.1 lipid A disaccharide synthase [Deinococcus radiopugnans]